MEHPIKIDDLEFWGYHYFSETSGHQGATKSKAFDRGTVQGIAQLRGHGPKCPESCRPIASWKMDERLVGVGRSTPAHYKYYIYIYVNEI